MRYVVGQTTTTTAIPVNTHFSPNVSDALGTDNDNFVNACRPHIHMGDSVSTSLQRKHDLE